MANQTDSGATDQEQTFALPRYERPVETVAASPVLDGRAPMPAGEVEAAIAASALSDGAKGLLRGLLRLGAVRDFPGGGVGIEYGSLLKTAARPDLIGGHIAEAASHLHERQVDLLLVPGMSGYPIGAMYAYAAGLPAILLKKAKLGADGQFVYPPGSFVIPSYTGDGDVVMSADPDAVRDIVAGVAARQIAAQADAAEVRLTLRCAGADDIIDKATMSQAVGESAFAIGEAALDAVIAARRASGDHRPYARTVDVAAWVTPLIKTYNDPQTHLARCFGIAPFAGLSITGVQFDPPAIGVEGVGLLPFARRD